MPARSASTCVLMWYTVRVRLWRSWREPVDSERLNIQSRPLLQLGRREGTLMPALKAHFLQRTGSPIEDCHSALGFLIER
jgi:hypothetical protein